tara:strand:+ start:86636 stop:87046 length:411 start_codon:yes stop_codon:yes gene_type:complete
MFVALNCTTKMQNTLLLFVFLFFAGFTWTQEKMTFKFDNIEEAVYNYDNQSFEHVGEKEDSGQIEIHFDKKAVVIDSADDEGDKQLKIIEKNEKNTKEEMYICAMNGEYYAFTISSDRKQLTLVSADYRFVYNLNN